MKQIFEKINKANRIALFTHCNADLDAYGSVGAIYHFLKGIDKNVNIFLCDPVDNKFDMLNLNDIKYEQEDNFDLAIALDCASLDRIEKFVPMFKNTPNILIDHHKNKTVFYDYGVVDSESPSTCELVYKFFKQNNIKITADMANCLYMGIMGDTGCLMHDNTNKDTYLIVSDLVEHGCDRVKIKQNILNNHKLNEVKVYVPIINNLEIFENIAFTKLTIKDKKNLKINENIETSDVLNLILSIENVNISIIFKQAGKNTWKISMRSKKGIDISQICISYGGGGHAQAAGFTYTGNLSNLKNDLIKELQFLRK